MDTNVRNEKKLVYLLNYVSDDDTQHFVHVLNLMTELQNLGWSVVVISEKGGVGTKRVLGHDVRYMSKHGGLDRLVRLGAELFALRQQGYKLVFVRISRPAILTAGVVGRIIGQKSLFWLSSANQDLDQSQPWIKRAAYNAQMGIILRLIDRFVTGPETMAKYFLSTLRVPAKKMMVLYNDIDLSRFTPTAREAKAASEPLRVLFVHSLSPNKEASRYFPQIISKLSEVSIDCGRIILSVIGRGPERATLEEMSKAARNMLTVEFLGGIPNMDIVAHYKSADVFIMPSYREGFPRVIVEAMAMGLPIVSTDAGGTRDLMGTRQQEYIVSRDDAVGFGQKLVQLISNADARRELTAENMVRVKRYSTETVARMYEDQLLQVLDEEPV